MANNWRLIVDRNSYADFSVSVSPAVERAVVEGRSSPTVYLNIFDSDSVTIGFNEDPEQTLDLEVCASECIHFRRRPNGGGPVYAGSGSAFLVYFVPTNHPRVPNTSAEAFPEILTALARILEERYGFPAEYRPLNDIEVQGRKLIPTSLKIENGVMTFRIVVNVKPIDTELAGKIMPMPPEKVADKELKDLTSRFTCLERECGRSFTEGELEALTCEAVGITFGERLEPGHLTKLEGQYADEFRGTYESEAWLFAKSERSLLGPILKPGDTVGYGRSKAVGGLIRATIALRGDRIVAAILNGDWHPRPLNSVEFLERELLGIKAIRSDIEKKVGHFLQREGIEFAGVGTEDLMKAIGIALETQKKR